ncbi:protoheme IX farnesyltransferase [Chitinophaga skermanii]|uniref:Protoheme IX farnesyltransferase n=1 Tax=Chitinophaga skermanii TaxID=331697 RepID=A0A327QD00_9BACT|nr:heme o synthase [Chitinophaga skermanii]RAJ01708.1 protoheme IX farnesyltransferase [Chitinophaga skermanii]
MLQENTIKLSVSYTVASRIKDYFQLMKFTLSFLVVFTCVVAYLLVPGVGFDVTKVLLLFLGGVLVSGSGSTVNQVIEKDSDKLMARTAPRPLPAGRISVLEASIFAVITGVAGVLIMGFAFNWLSAWVSLASLILYGFVYTPWKKWNSFAVLIGAFPGALPPLIGWVAGAGEFSEGGWSLFTIQFLWQFPHFWAIAWVAHNDYTRAGFRLLPSDKGPNRSIALQSAVYAGLLIPAGVVPSLLNICQPISAVLTILAGIYYFYLALMLVKKSDVPSARRLMLGSYIYLAITFLALLAGKQ